jgi:hypothetical protein
MRYVCERFSLSKIVNEVFSLANMEKGFHTCRPPKPLVIFRQIRAVSALELGIPFKNLIWPDGPFNMCGADLPLRHLLGPTWIFVVAPVEILLPSGHQVSSFVLATEYYKII